VSDHTRVPPAQHCATTESLTITPPSPALYGLLFDAFCPPLPSRPAHYGHLMSHIVTVVKRERGYEKVGVKYCEGCEMMAMGLGNGKWVPAHPIPSHPIPSHPIPSHPMCFSSCFNPLLPTARTTVWVLFHFHSRDAHSVHATYRHYSSKPHVTPHRTLCTPVLPFPTIPTEPSPPHSHFPKTQHDGASTTKPASPASQPSPVDPAPHRAGGGSVSPSPGISAPPPSLAST
jgi:hypothetical protein